jgi:hypothetical protein
VECIDIGRNHQAHRMVIGMPDVYYFEKQGQYGEQEQYFLDRVFGVAKHFNLSEKTDRDLSPAKT